MALNWLGVNHQRRTPRPGFAGIDNSIRQAPAFFKGNDPDKRPDKKTLAAMPSCGS
jgi:hypothetical protein